MSVVLFASAIYRKMIDSYRFDLQYERTIVQL